ncbi:MAG: tRNA (adenosine(37)-N6)-threonylcarbamoyltransferase complex ATPase subunit type 1 TsaE [Melioribacteraceae bacterium]|nr:tRNA (adenosine(37)-N6)-threonylcarbamoyltransferase complex ATPase subunit type 1 TsaE [Melioribacteraceae bacterium]
MIELPLRKIINSEDDTTILANEFSKIVELSDIICLNGNLGTGKTFFVKEFCKNYKINNVNSPSFSIVNEYFGDANILHFDFYRIKKIEELFDIGFNEYILRNDTIIFIEWANMFQEIIPKKHYEINIKIIDDAKREFTINKHE